MLENALRGAASAAERPLTTMPAANSDAAVARDAAAPRVASSDAGQAVPVITPGYHSSTQTAPRSVAAADGSSRNASPLPPLRHYQQRQQQEEAWPSSKGSSPSGARPEISAPDGINRAGGRAQHGQARHPSGAALSTAAPRSALPEPQQAQQLGQYRHSGSALQQWPYGVPPVLSFHGNAPPTPATAAVHASQEPRALLSPSTAAPPMPSHRNDHQQQAPDLSSPPPPPTQRHARSTLPPAQSSQLPLPSPSFAAAPVPASSASPARHRAHSSSPASAKKRRVSEIGTDYGQRRAHVERGNTTASAPKSNGDVAGVADAETGADAPPESSAPRTASNSFHKQVEQRRRRLIASRIDDLGEMVPEVVALHDRPSKRPDKVTVLTMTVTHMQEVTRQKNALESEVASLRERLFALESAVCNWRAPTQATTAALLPSAAHFALPSRPSEAASSQAQQQQQCVSSCALPPGRNLGQGFARNGNYAAQYHFPRYQQGQQVVSSHYRL